MDVSTAHNFGNLRPVTYLAVLRLSLLDNVQ